MWLLLLITILTAIADDRGWGNLIRFHIGIEFNLYLILALLGVAGCFFLRGGARRVVAEHVHPLLLFIAVIGGIAWLIGLWGSLQNTDNVYLWLVAIAIRDFIALPVFVIIGYSLTATPRDLKRMAVASVVAGALASFFITLSFVARSGQLSASDNVSNALRVEAFTTTYPAIACLLLFYAILAGIRLAGPRMLLLAVCLFGVVTPLNRSDWISLLAGVVAIILMLPRQRWVAVSFRALAVGILLFATLWVGLFAASKLTGRDFYDTFGRRIASVLPFTDEGRSAKAWDSRIPGILHDLDIISANPVFGGGFGAQERTATGGPASYAEFHHCAWTDLTAKTGIFGFIMLCLIIFGPGVLGRRLMRDGVSEIYVLLGATAVGVAAYAAVLAASTMSINMIRGAIPIGIFVGIIIRAREMQLIDMAQHELAPDAFAAAAPIEGVHSWEGPDQDPGFSW